MKYRKKPVIVEAVQLTQDLVDSLCPENTYETNLAYRGNVEFRYHTNLKTFLGAFVRTLEGNMRGSLNDWLITGVKGEQYFCKPDIFEQTYEKVEEEG